MDRKVLMAIACVLAAKAVDAEIQGEIIMIKTYDYGPDPVKADFSHYHEPPPKPVKTRLKIKQAPKQPFRLSMRSVNRNR